MVSKSMAPSPDERMARVLRDLWPETAVPAPVAAMLRPQLADERIGEHFVGLGWYCSGEGDDVSFGHSGVAEGFLAEMRVYPARPWLALARRNLQGDRPGIRLAGRAIARAVDRHAARHRLCRRLPKRERCRGRGRAIGGRARAPHR